MFDLPYATLYDLLDTIRYIALILFVILVMRTTSQSPDPALRRLNTYAIVLSIASLFVTLFLIATRPR